MNSASHRLLHPREVAGLLAAYPKRWLAPTIVVAAAAIAYAAFGPLTWDATQALIVRNEAASKENGQGKFRQPEDMKTVQETILELVKSRGVLESALKEVGPPAAYRGEKEAWPTDRDVVALRKHVRLAPPKGAEFGKTEVFYLEVQDGDRQRTVALNRAIYDQLQGRFQQLRDAKAQSMIDELVRTEHLAKSDLKESTARLTAIETKVGSDLADLRALQDSSSSDSALRKTTTEIRSELREIRTTAKAHEELLSLLKTASDDPGRLVAAPNRLLESQPALRRLKDGLVDAQLHAAKLQGNMSPEHPLVRSALQSAEEIGRHLHDELAIAMRGVEVELRLCHDRETLLDEQLASVTGRLDRLAELRAGYSNEVAENANRVALVERAEQNLAEARAALAGANAASLISRIDAPEAGINPVGPSRAVIALLGVLGGLLTGCGILYLTVPVSGDCPNFRVNENGTVPFDARTVASSTEHPSPRPAAASAFRANGSLSFKQALEKLACGSKV